MFWLTRPFGVYASQFKFRRLLWQKSNVRAVTPSSAVAWAGTDLTPVRKTAVWSYCFMTRKRSISLRASGVGLVTR